jgi:hypothetical protein
MPPPSQGRIPQALQAVFVASNGGNDVHKPPPEGVASRVYMRNWVHHNEGGGSQRSLAGSAGSVVGSSTRSLYGDSMGKINTLSNSIPDQNVGQRTRRPSFREGAKVSIFSLISTPDHSMIYTHRFICPNTECTARASQ